MFTLEFRATAYTPISEKLNRGTSIDIVTDKGDLEIGEIIIIKVNLKDIPKDATELYIIGTFN